MPYDDHTTDVLQRQNIRVASIQDRVILEIAKFGCTLDYETALKLSQWIRLMAKKSKAFAGDKSRHWSAIGYLEDAEEAYKRG